MTRSRGVALLAVLTFSFCMGLAQPAAPRWEIAQAAQPQLTLASEGRIWLVYGQLADAPAAPSAGHAHKGHPPPSRSGDVFVASSSDGGATFGPPVKVATVPNLMLGMRRGPRIAAHGDRVTVTLIAHELLAYVSDDAGKTWSEPLVVNEIPTSAREGLHDLAGGPDGTLYVTWLDLRNGKTELWGASSKDAGRTWAKNEQIYRSPDKTICECCHPSALFDRDGNLAVMWRNSIEGARDMWLAVRPEGAARFNTARKLGDGTWKLNACPMDGGRIVALGAGQFGAVWQRAGEVFFTGADGAEVHLGKGKQPVAVRGADDELVVVWQEGAGVVVRRGLRASSPVKHAADARFPSLLLAPSGGALLAYERGPKAATSVVVERL